MEEENSYELDATEEDQLAYEEYEERKKKKEQKKEKEEDPMGDVYDVYAKAVGVHSKVTDMTEDYTLTRYDKDVYNQKFPKFIREQRKVLRIVKSYLIVPKERLREFYNNETIVTDIHDRLKQEYKIIEELIIGELDECVIMGRTPEGEVIKAFLEHGLNPREEFNLETAPTGAGAKLKERTPQ